MTTDFSVTLTRFCCLFWPSFVLVLLIIRRRPNPRLSGAALVATLWNLCALLILNRLAISQQWWSYHTQSGLFMGMPGDLLLGWALLWGAIPALAFQNRPLWQSLLLLLITDLILMPACTPVITLGTQWLLGEALAITIALLPSLFLTRWILYKTFLKAKVILLVVGYTCLMLFVLPSLILEQTKSSWETALTRPLEFSGLILQLTFLVAIPALSAVQEFFQRGVGTPLPFDPPRRMVTSGPYAYLVNPMQTGGILVLLMWGWWTSSLWITAASLIAYAYACIACWHESEDLKIRFGDVWTLYRSEVHLWIPRWRPRILFPCTLYVAETCHPCSQLASWLRARKPTGLIIVAAESHPTKRLRRITYEAPGWSENGILAIARALEHLHLGWAWIGWTLRLPLIAPSLQCLLDLSGGGERVLQDKNEYSS